MIDAVINIFAQAIQAFYSVTQTIGFPNYGLAIILLTLVIKLILFPLTRKQFLAMGKMQEIQPELKEVKEKYKNDPQRSQKEMMALYQKHGVNPLAGCLPLLVQLPILLALFRTLRIFFDPQGTPGVNVNMSHADFLWIPNLGNPDPIILPILVAVGAFAQQKMTMQAGMGQGGGQQTQKVLLYFMPLFIGYISRSFPAGLALYFVTYSVFGIIEQYVIRRPQVAKEETGRK